MPAGFGVDDGAALHYVGGGLVRMVASRPRARVYRVERRGRNVVEDLLRPDLL